MDRRPGGPQSIWWQRVGHDWGNLAQTHTYINSCSVAQLCLTLCDPIDCSMPSFPVLHCLLEFAQTHAHWVGDTIHPTISSSVTSFSWPQFFPGSGYFPKRWLFASGGQNIGVWALASVLPMSIQDWFPLGLTSLILLQSKGLSRVFSSTTI